LQDACFLFVAAPEKALSPADLQNVQIAVMDVER
jgi:hypothetical protein